MNTQLLQEEMESLERMIFGSSVQRICGVDQKSKSDQIELLLHFFCEVIGQLIKTRLSPTTKKCFR